MDDQEEEINSSIVVATLVGKLQELLARAVETAMHTPDYFFNVVRYERVTITQYLSLKPQIPISTFDHYKIYNYTRHLTRLFMFYG